jgi:hypothetical protein
MSEQLKYINHDGCTRVVKGCNLVVDKLGRHWLWSEQLKQNLTYKIKGRENALLDAISSLLFLIELRDNRIKSLQRIANLANEFCDQINPVSTENE